jgi:Flp pilus assembly protein TadG
MIGRNTNKRRGSIMLTTAISLFVLMGMLGLSIDLGRVYIAKNEAQAFADLAAISAARYLNGKQAGIDSAKADVTTSTNSNLWNFSTVKFGSNAQTSPAPTVEFSTAATGAAWSTAPAGNLTLVKFVRVTATPSVNLAFLPAVGTALTQQVTGQAIAGVIPQTFPAGGYLPFTPFAHDASKDASGNLIDPNFGFTVGQEYGFLWPGNINNKNNACAGDQVNWPMYNSSDNSVVAGSDRGYFELQSASSISDAILGGKQTDPLNVGDTIDLTNGQKQAEQNALELRASYDTDQTQYQANSNGIKPAYSTDTVANGGTGANGMRLVIMPVNDRNPVNGEVKVIGFASFLLPMHYPNGGNKAWCAIYMGAQTDGGGSTEFTPGAYVVRLVQ